VAGDSAGGSGAAASVETAQAGTSTASVETTPATPDATGSPIGFGQALPQRTDTSGGTTVALLGLALALVASIKVVGRRLARP